MGQDLKDDVSLVKESGLDVKREFKQCHRLRRPTYKFINLLIVLAYTVLKLVWASLVDWYSQLCKWGRYVAPSIPYVSSRL